MAPGLTGDPKFATNTSGWTGSGLTITRDTSAAAQIQPASYKWGSNVASGKMAWAGTFGYASTKASIVANSLVVGQWYFVQAFLKSVTATSPRLQVYANNANGNFAGNIPHSFSAVGDVRYVTVRFKASSTTQTIDFFNYDPTQSGDSVYLNGLFIVDHKLDPSFKDSISGWERSTEYSNAYLTVMTGTDTAGFFPNNAFITAPKNSDGAFFDIGALGTYSGTSNQYTQAAVFTKDDCIPGTTYQVLLRVLRDKAFKWIPLYLQVDGTQISWNADQVDRDWTVIWGTFKATASAHDIKIVNGDQLGGGYAGLFVGLEIKAVSDSMGETLKTTSTPQYPAKINQTLYPCQTGYDQATVPELVRQFQYMKDVGITELVLEQVVNMTELKAYYDTSMKTAQVSVDPVTGLNVNLPVVQATNNLVDRIIEAKDIVGGIDLWWGIGRYWPWENSPVLGSDVTSTTDSTVKWTTASWSQSTWNENGWGRGNSAEALAANKLIVQELVTKYGSHIKGWYLPLEIESYGATFEANLAWFRCLFYELTKMCLTAKTGIPVMVSPFYQDLAAEGSSSEMEVKKRYAQMILNEYAPAAKYAMTHGATKFILAQQDGLGDVDRSIQGSEKIYHALYNTNRISDKPGDNLITLWHNLDLYDVVYGNGNPMDPVKLQTMMNSTNLLEKRTSFSFASQLTPQIPSRRPYWSAYRKYALGTGASFSMPFELDY